MKDEISSKLNYHLITYSNLARVKWSKWPAVANLMSDEADPWWPLPSASCLLSVAGVAELIFTSHWANHEKNPPLPTGLEIRSKVELPMNPRNVPSAGLAEICSVWTGREGSFCLTALQIHGVGSAWGFSVLTSKLQALTPEDWVLCGLTKVVKNSELPYLRANALLSKFLIIQYLFPFSWWPCS